MVLEVVVAIKTMVVVGIDIMIMMEDISLVATNNSN